MRALLVGAAAFALSACATVPNQPTDSLDRIAQDYVLLQLTIGQKEDGYIDAYYGSEELKAQAEAAATEISLPLLEAQVVALRLRANGFADDGVEGATLDERRARFLAAQLTAARTRIKMMRGTEMSFIEEAEGLFGVTPETPPLESFEPVIASIETLIPGEGALWERIDTFNSRFDIPADKLSAVFDAAIAECKRRTSEHIDLPAGESFSLGYVRDKPWSGYNYYQGGYQSKIEINTDLPVKLSRVVDLGCHEGYPGHHAFNALLEKNLVNERGWIEFSVYPLYSPQSLIAEGSANYGIDLAFPGDEQLVFETKVLAPLAGLPTEELQKYRDLGAAMRALGPARYTIAAQYLAGEIDADRARTLLQKYQLVSPKRAAQSLRFIDTYGSYIINYGLGRDMVQAHVEAAGESQDARWERMIGILSEPPLPSDL